MIHTIGDSHSYTGWQNIKDMHINMHHLGPKLCFSIGRDGINIDGFNINDGDTVIFCLGEIDCRCHIHNHITDTITYQDIINNIIHNYLEAIEVNIFNLQIKLKNVCIYNVVPPIQKHNTFENPDYPYLGTDEDRKKYVLYFNEKLKDKCTEKDYIFFDIYDKYIDKNGFLRKDLSDGNVHIYDPIYIKLFIETNIGLRV